jgi:hypothetical protein
MEFKATFQVDHTKEIREVFIFSKPGDNIFELAWSGLSPTLSGFKVSLVSIVTRNELDTDLNAKIMELDHHCGIVQRQIQKNTLWLPLTAIMATALGLALGWVFWS